MIGMTRWRASLAVVVIPLALSGCSGASGAVTPTADVPHSSPSGALQTYAGDGFEMLLPTDWTVLTPDDKGFGTLLEGMDGFLDSDALEQQVRTMFQQGGRLVALDLLHAHPGFVDNIVILRLPLPGLTATAVESVTVQQFADLLGATEIESEIRAVPAGEAVVVYYTLPSVGSEGISVTLLTTSAQWAISLSAIDVGPLEGDFATMIDSFSERP